jgi:hypothetical protein
VDATLRDRASVSAPGGRGVAPPRGARSHVESHWGTARKLEERAEEIVDSYLRAGQQGDWRALDALVNRVYGKPTEHLVTEPPKPRWQQEMDELSLEELEALRDRYRTTERLKAVERRKAEPQGPPRPPLGSSKEEVFAWRAEMARFKQKRLQAVQEADEEEAV